MHLSHKSITAKLVNPPINQNPPIFPETPKNKVAIQYCGGADHNDVGIVGLGTQLICVLVKGIAQMGGPRRNLVGV